MNLDADIAIKFLIKHMMNNNDDFYYMNEALKEAYKAYRADEVPVWCVFVHNWKIIARAHNKRQKKHDVFGHAEIVAIKKATKRLHSWILDEATMYVTLEPCLMCAGSILQSRIKKLVYATCEQKFGVIESKMQIFNNQSIFNHSVEVVSGIFKLEASELLKEYFKQKRKSKIKKKK